MENFLHKGKGKRRHIGPIRTCMNILHINLQAVHSYQTAFGLISMADYCSGRFTVHGGGILFCKQLFLVITVFLFGQHAIKKLKSKAITDIFIL